MLKLSFPYPVFCCLNHPISPQKLSSQIKSSAQCVTLITGTQAVGVQRKLRCFFRQYWRSATQGHTRGSGALCFHGFTKVLFEVGLKEIWNYNNFAGRVESQSRSSLSCGGTEAMSVTFAERKWNSNRTGGTQEVQEGGWKGTEGAGERGGGGGVEEQKVQGGEWGSDGENLPPVLSQPHTQRLLPLIVIAVQTRPTAATNISCLIWHTWTLTYGHKHTHAHTLRNTDFAQMASFAVSLYGTLLSVFLVLAI